MRSYSKYILFLFAVAACEGRSTDLQQVEASGGVNGGGVSVGSRVGGMSQRALVEHESPRAGRQGVGRMDLGTSTADTSPEWRKLFYEVHEYLDNWLIAESAGPRLLETLSPAVIRLDGITQTGFSFSLAEQSVIASVGFFGAITTSDAEFTGVDLEAHVYRKSMADLVADQSFGEAVLVGSQRVDTPTESYQDIYVALDEGDAPTTLDPGVYTVVFSFRKDLGEDGVEAIAEIPAWFQPNTSQIFRYSGDQDPGEKFSLLGNAGFRTYVKRGFPSAFIPYLTPLCGDGIVHYLADNPNIFGETCDDGNVSSGDGCSVSCQVEEGYTCEQVEDLSELPNSRCGKCGDGRINDFVGEVCDDGNLDTGDGCSDNCQIEEGYACGVVADPAELPNSQCGKCGDGRLTELLGEACDDGNLDAGDGCSGNCQVEEGYTCGVVEDLTELPNSQCGQCGDGDINELIGEVCDDGNLNAGDGCSATCSIEEDYDCNVELVPPAAVPDETPITLSPHTVTKIYERKVSDRGQSVPYDNYSFKDFSVVHSDLPAAASDVEVEIMFRSLKTIHPTEKYVELIIGSRAYRKNIILSDSRSSYRHTVTLPRQAVRGGDFKVQFLDKTGGGSVISSTWITGSVRLSYTYRAPGFTVPDGSQCLRQPVGVDDALGWRAQIDDVPVELAASACDPEDDCYGGNKLVLSKALFESGGDRIGMSRKGMIGPGATATVSVRYQPRAGAYINFSVTSSIGLLSSSAPYGFSSQARDPEVDDAGWIRQTFDIENRSEAIQSFSLIASSKFPAYASREVWIDDVIAVNCDADISRCGDGITDAMESCDDGDDDDHDCCTSRCQPATCGDGFIQPALETCDDGNTEDGDGCDQHCQIEPEWECGVSKFALNSKKYWPESFCSLCSLSLEAAPEASSDQTCPGPWASVITGDESEKSRVSCAEPGLLSWSNMMEDDRLSYPTRNTVSRMLNLSKIGSLGFRSRLENETDAVEFFVDDELVYTHSLSVSSRKPSVTLEGYDDDELHKVDIVFVQGETSHNRWMNLHELSCNARPAGDL